jgi:hypothetical protein
MRYPRAWVFGVVIPAGVAALFLLGVFDGLLLGMGRFLAPVWEPSDKADVVIVEGTEHIQPGLAETARGFLAAGKAKRLVFVLSASFQPEPGALSLVTEIVEYLKRDGYPVSADDVSIIATPVQHPVTLQAAEAATSTLAEQGVKTAILVSPGFHARRSYLVYQYLGATRQIRIFPVSSFAGHEHGLEGWWTQRAGVSDFIEQALKLLYYMVRGYIPPRLS